MAISASLNPSSVGAATICLAPLILWCGATVDKMLTMRVLEYAKNPHGDERTRAPA